MCSSCGIGACRRKIVLDRINQSSFGATYWYFPTMDVWIEIVNVRLK